MSSLPAGYSGIQVTGMIEGIFGFKIFDSGIFWVRKFGKYFFVWLDLSEDLIRDGGIQNSLKVVVVPAKVQLNLFCLHI